MKNIIALATENPFFAGVLTLSGILLIIGAVKAFNRNNEETVPTEPDNSNPDQAPSRIINGAEIIMQTARVPLNMGNRSIVNAGVVGGTNGARVSSVKG